MLLLSIVNNSHKDYVLGKIENIITYLNDKGLKLCYEVDDDEEYQVIEFKGEFKEEAQSNMRVFQYYIASILYDVALEEFLKGKCNKYLSETFNFLNHKDITVIKDVVHNVLKEEVAIDETVIYCMNRKNDAIQKIISCMDEVEELNLKGFLDFRAKDIDKEIFSMVEKVVEKYMVEKEYNEFINLLKYFVEVQECKTERVDLFVKNDKNEYLLIDEKGNDMMQSLLEELCDNKTMGEISKDDLIISGLITTCPRKIVIHSSSKYKNIELVKTIQSVFEDRVEYCNDIGSWYKENENMKITIDNNVNM